MSDSENGESRKWLDRLADLFNDEPSNRGELMQVLKVAADRDILDSEALNIIYGALQMSEMQAREIMIPRAQIISVRADDTPAEFLETVIASQHSRFPVIDDDLDDIKGILHAKDLLPLALAIAGGEAAESFDLRDHIRPAAIVPESKRLNILLQEFRARRNHMAIVVDEYGNTAGIVTIEDVLEQIVGEIEDEHDAHDTAYIKQLDEQSFTVKAVTPIDEFNEHFNASFRDDEFDTIGGIVLQSFGEMPEREDTVDVEGFRFKVLNADSRRIRLLHLTTHVAAVSE